MEVILREHIDNLGRRGDVVKVAAGYARNYLLPRKLAYEIKHHREAVYVVETISSASGDVMKEIDRRLRVIDQVIRHLVVRVDEELRVAERTRDARKANQARRRVARGLPPEPAPGESRGDQDVDDDREGLEVSR